MSCSEHEMIAARLATESDAESLVHLILEWDSHYFPDRPRPAPAAVREMLSAIRADKEFGTVFALAFTGSEPAGFASFAVIHPDVQLKSVIFLREIFVLPRARGKGIGRALLGCVARFVRQKGGGRMDLATGDHNHGAQRFYESLGAQRLDRKIMYRFDAAAMERLAEET